MHINRYLRQEISNKLDNYSKIIVLYGARQVGKTTLIKSLLAETKYKILEITADEERYVDYLSSRNLSKLKSLVDGYDVLYVDEAQRIPEIGINLKLLHDNLNDLKIIVTGSSSLDLASKISEPLTGRTWTYTLYPISVLEKQKLLNPVELETSLEESLIYGSYPNLYNLPSIFDKSKYLTEISRSYLYKDILELTDLRNPGIIKNLLKLLAFQIGSEVSLTELGGQLGISKDTVSRYIKLLENSFVLFRLSGFSRNLRKEVSKMDKIYFYDNGIRNIIIDNLKMLKDRDDIGKLWENYLVAERKKYLDYTNVICSRYFWRIYTGAEIDYVEEREGQLYGYEFKWKKTSVRIPKMWLKTYSNAKFELVNRENYLSFVAG